MRASLPAFSTFDSCSPFINESQSVSACFFSLCVYLYLVSVCVFVSLTIECLPRSSPGQLLQGQSNDLKRIFLATRVEVGWQLVKEQHRFFWLERLVQWVRVCATGATSLHPGGFSAINGSRHVDGFQGGTATPPIPDEAFASAVRDDEGVPDGNTADTVPDAKSVAEARPLEMAKLGVYFRAWTRVSARLLRARLRSGRP